MAVSIGRSTVMPEMPPIVNDPPTEYEGSPISVPMPEYEVVEEMEPNMVYQGRFYITGYDPHCAHCCGKTDGITASGTVAKVGRTCAGGAQFAIGTRLYIDGLGERIVEDRGAFESTTIDVVCENHEACYAITGYREVWVVEDAE